MATTKQVRTILSMYDAGDMIKDIESATGINRRQIYDVLIRHGVERKRKRGRHATVKPAVKRGRQVIRAEYALYDTHDNILMCGTADECAEYLDIQKGSFYKALSRQKDGRQRHIYIVKLSSEE